MKKLVPLVAVIIVAATAFVLLQRNNNVAKHEEKTEATEERARTEVGSPIDHEDTKAIESSINEQEIKAARTSDVKVDPALSEDITLLDEFKEISAEHKTSLLQMTRRIFPLATEKTEVKDIVQALNKYKLEPKVGVDKNPFTGSMSVIRTNKTLPGTRYFHTQYFDEEQGGIVQHLSFEFKPGTQSFEAVVKAVAEGLPAHAEVTVSNSGYQGWRNIDGYIVWVKKLDESDLSPDTPFNAYTKNDVGTIRVVKEIDIHDHAPAFKAQQREEIQEQEKENEPMIHD